MCLGMKLVQFIHQGRQKIGIQTLTSIVSLTDGHGDMPNNMIDFLKKHDELMKIARKLQNCNKNVISSDEVKFLPPITGCEKIICIGMNYKDHCTEQNVEVPTEPVVFNKFPSAIAGNGDNILLPSVSNAVDWEVELAVVIGKQGKNIEKMEAMKYIAGYMVANDVSARDWQMHKNGHQWLLGKTFDTFCPIGPALVTKDNVKNPNNLGLRCLVNGKLMQDSNTNQLVFGIDECISWVSKICTLKPGDILLTGTPPGVGVFRKPPIYLKEGDEVVCEIEDIGRLTNIVVAE
ncbi:unnamed protein product [Clavelina lepadiformis]|uniref:Fumarylacetoacetase-like C-terminal domain-containing protein n=1 Tax=Clavelina lepadiformis TaxID=159417 RepID=A0ABP0G169_CLALP